MSGGRTREERLQLQERDDGDPGDAVYYARARTTNNKGYHADRECKHLQDSELVVEVTREQAWAMGRYPCSWCVLEETHASNDSEWSSITHTLRSEDVTSVAEAAARHNEEESA